MQYLETNEIIFIRNYYACKYTVSQKRKHICICQISTKFYDFWQKDG